MKFARVVYALAAVWGFLVLPPLYWMERRIGVEQPPAITHAEYFYGFLGVALAWQIAFGIISRDPVRYRPLMIACMAEKFSFFAACSALAAQHRVPAQVFFMSVVDFCLGIAFIAAYAQTRPRSPVPAPEAARDSERG